MVKRLSRAGLHGQIMEKQCSGRQKTKAVSTSYRTLESTTIHW